MSERETEEELQAAVELATGLGAAGRSSRGVPVIAPARSNVPSILPSPITSRGYSPYGAAQPANTLTARQALVNARRATAANATNAGGHIYGRPAPPPPSYPQRPIGSGPRRPGLYGTGPSALLRPLAPGVWSDSRIAAGSPFAQSASEALTASLQQQAMPANQFGVPYAHTGATWARMKQGAQLATAPGGNMYAGVTVQAGEQVVAASSAVNVGGYSNYYRQIWVKRGQTFDASSWKTGWVHEAYLNISNMPATWGQQGFGALEDEMNELEMAIGLGAGGALSPSARSLAPVTPIATNLPPPPVQVYEGGHPQANATLLQQVWSGQYWIAKGSRVKATPAGGQMYNVECFIGPPRQMLIGPIHVPASSLKMDPAPPIPYTPPVPTIQSGPSPLPPVSNVRGIIAARQQALAPVQKAPPLSIHAPKTGGHVPVPLYRVTAIEAPHNHQGQISAYDENNQRAWSWWFENPNATQWDCQSRFGNLFSTGDVCNAHGGGAHALAYGAELWVSTETMSVSWYGYPNKGWNVVQFYRLYKIGNTPVSGWVMQQTVGSLNGIFPSGTAGLPEGFAGAPGENVMDEMEFATGLGAAMAMSSFATHRALSPTAHSAPCPTGYHPEVRLVAPGVTRTVCVQNPTALAPPAGGRGYSPYGAAQGGSPLTASMALRRAIMSQALPGDQRRAPPRSYGPPYQYGGLHGSPELDVAAGLGAVMVEVGFGVLGPFGNASTLDPDEYQITGDGVYMWNGPQSDAGSISDANGKSIFLNTGDRVTASGDVTLDTGNGKYYAKVLSDKAPNAPEIWVAVEYLAPLSWQRPAAPVTPVAPPKPAQPPNALLPAGKTDYTVPILVGAGVLGAGLIGYALYRKKKGKKAHAR